jgi:hypothetical protein
MTAIFCIFAALKNASCQWIVIVHQDSTRINPLCVFHLMRENASLVALLNILPSKQNTKIAIGIKIETKERY